MLLFIRPEPANVQCKSLNGLNQASVPLDIFRTVGVANFCLMAIARAVKVKCKNINHVTVQAIKTVQLSRSIGSSVSLHLSSTENFVT